jgi:hypothetical protein
MKRIVVVLLRALRQSLVRGVTRENLFRGLIGLAVLGGILYLSLATSYSNKWMPPYRGDIRDTISIFRLTGADSICHFTITPDGASLNFIYKKNGRWIFWNDGGDWGDMKCCYKDSSNNAAEITVSPDSAHVAIVYGHDCRWRDSGPHPAGDSGGQWFVNIDHHLFGGFDRDFKPTVRFSPDGKKFGFPYKKLGSYYVQVVDTTFGPYRRADLTITRDGAIYLGYIKQDSACIEKIYEPHQGQ